MFHQEDMDMLKGHGNTLIDLERYGEQSSDICFIHGHHLNVQELKEKYLYHFVQIKS